MLFVVRQHWTEQIHTLINAPLSTPDVITPTLLHTAKRFLKSNKLNFICSSLFNDLQIEYFKHEISLFPKRTRSESYEWFLLGFFHTHWWVTTTKTGTILSNGCINQKKKVLFCRFPLSLWKAESYFSLPGVKQGFGGAQGSGRGFSRLSGMTKSSRVPGCRMHLNPSAGCEQTAFALVFGRSRTAGHHSIQPVITTWEAPLINGRWVTPTINYSLRIIISQTLKLHYGTEMKHYASPLTNHFTNCQAHFLPVSSPWFHFGRPVW